MIGATNKIATITNIYGLAKRLRLQETIMSLTRIIGSNSKFILVLICVFILTVFPLVFPVQFCKQRKQLFF